MPPVGESNIPEGGEEFTARWEPVERRGPYIPPTVTEWADLRPYRVSVELGPIWDEAARLIGYDIPSAVWSWVYNDWGKALAWDIVRRMRASLIRADPYARGNTGNLGRSLTVWAPRRTFRTVSDSTAGYIVVGVLPRAASSAISAIIGRPPKMYFTPLEMGSRPLPAGAYFGPVVRERIRAWAVRAGIDVAAKGVITESGEYKLRDPVRGIITKIARGGSRPHPFAARAVNQALLAAGDIGAARGIVELLERRVEKLSPEGYTEKFGDIGSPEER